MYVACSIISKAAKIAVLFKAKKNIKYASSSSSILLLLLFSSATHVTMHPNHSQL
jgi:hypothetical protein